MGTPLALWSAVLAGGIEAQGGLNCDKNAPKMHFENAPLKNKVEENALHIFRDAKK